MLLSNLFFFLSFVTLIIAQQPVEIGTLTTRAHDVTGTVFALNSRQLSVQGLHYDGLGPDAYFWVGTGSTPNADGMRVPFLANCSIPGPLPAYNDATVELELLNNLQLADIGHFSIWCEKVSQNFGEVVVDAGDLQGVPTLGQSTCVDSDSEKVEPFPVPDRWNCEPLNDDYQVRWVVNNSNIVIELVGRIDETQYMGFGVSGSDTNTNMTYSDVAIAYRNGDEFEAVDFFVTSRQPCSSGRGVCPDEQLATDAGTNDINHVSGASEGDLTMVRYTRPLAAIDPIADRPISTSETTFISWAIGPLDLGPLLPRFHEVQTSFPMADVSIRFGRSFADRCTQLFIKDGEEAVPGFIRPTISETTNVTARIGPPGGSRGYGGITQSPSWGFAWYMSPTGTTGEDILIPAIAVERGKTYTFTVQGGVDDGSEVAYHPLYITSSTIGGYASNTPYERAQEKVYAGITDIETDDNGNVTSFRSTATGALCDIKSSLVGDTVSLKTWEDYAETLDLSCAENETIQENSGTLVWRVPDNAPDLLYYQCVTHRSFGYKLVVFDEGNIDQARLEEESGGGGLKNESQEEAQSECKVTFNGSERSYQGCRKDLSGDVEVYWTLREQEGEIDTLFRAPTNGGFVGFGWGYSKMDGSNAVIAFQNTNGDAQIADYFLESKSTQGVQPNNNQKLINAVAELNGNFVVGVFTRKLVVEGIPTIVKGLTPAIWSVGVRPDSETTLVRHDIRGIGEIDLSVASGGTQESSASRLAGDVYYTAHAILMITGWLALTPTAIIMMKYFKGFNPTTFRLHRGLNTLSIAAVISAYAMGVARGSRIEIAHLVLGTIATAFGLIQVVSGIARPKKDSASFKPWYFSHAVSGYLAVHFAMANALLGMILFNVEAGWYAAWGVLVGLYILAHVVLFAFRSKIPYEDSTPNPKGAG